MNNKLFQSNTYQAMWVGLGSIASFAFSIISAAVLSRFLSKSEYGTYKQVMYVYNTLLVVFTLGLPKAYAYFLPRFDIKYGNGIVNKINVIFFLIGLIFTLLLYFGAPTIATILQNPDLVSSMRLFAITPVFILPTMGIEGIMSTYKKNYINAIYTIITRILMLLLVALPAVLYRADCNTAIVGFSISSIITCVIGLIVKKIPYRGIESVKAQLSYSEIFRFSLPLMLASLGGIAIKSADQFFVSRYFGSEVFADFANGSTDLPFVGMILSAAATVLLPEFSRSLASNKDSYNDIIDLWRRTAVKSALILYPLIVFCMFFSSDIMVCLYGNLYAASAVYFFIILIVDLFTIAPYYPIIIALGATKYYANVHLCLALTVWVLEFVVVLFFSSALAIAITSAVMQIIKVIVMTKFIANKLNVRIVDIFPIRELLTIISSNVLCGIVVFILFTRIIQINNLFISLMLSFVTYVLMLFFTEQIFELNYLAVVQPFFHKIKR